MKENGLLQKILDSYQAKEQVCPDYNGKALDIKSCITIFIIIGTGFGMSALVWIMEKFKVTRQEEIQFDNSRAWIENEIQTLQVYQQNIAFQIEKLKHRLSVLRVDHNQIN